MWSRVTRAAIDKHDEELAKTFQAGSRARILTAIKDFLKWAKTERYVYGQAYDQAMETLDGCLTTCRKDVQERNVERRVDEEQELMGPETSRSRGG